MTNYNLRKQNSHNRFFITVLAFVLCITAASCTPLHQIYNNMGREKLTAGEFEEAIKYFDMCIDDSPEQAVCHYNKCLALYNLGKLTEAVKECVTTNKLDKDFAPAYRIRCMANVQLKQYEYAVENCTKVISLEPDNAHAYNNRAMSNRHLGNTDEALADYSRSIEINPKNIAPFYNRSQIFATTGNFEAALEDLNIALELDPQSTLVLNEKCKVLNDSRRSEEALESCNKAIETDPNFPIAYINRGISLANLKKTDEAIESYNKAIELDPDSPLVYVNRAVLFNDIRDPDSSIADSRKALEMDASLFMAYQNLGVAYEIKKEYEEAVKVYTKGLELEPGNIQFYYNRALVFAKMGNYDDAIKDIDYFIQHAPESGIYFVRGLINEGFEKYDDAVQDYSMAIEKESDFYAAYEKRSKCYKKLGMNAEAAKDLETARNITKMLDLDSAAVAFTALLKTKKYDEAVRMFHEPVDMTEEELLEEYTALEEDFRNAENILGEFSTLRRVNQVMDNGVSTYLLVGFMGASLDYWKKYRGTVIMLHYKVDYPYAGNGRIKIEFCRTRNRWEVKSVFFQIANTKENKERVDMMYSFKMESVQ